MAARALYRSTIGKKVVMAVTGLILVGFVIGHMIGNLKVFTGREHFNEYAEGLRIIGAPFFAYGQLLWVIRIVLLLAVGLHIWSAVTLTRRNLTTRESRYAKKKVVSNNYAAYTMRWGGLLIFMFIIYHLLHFTIGSVHPNFVHGNAYNNLVIGFQNPIVAVVYLITMLALTFHLYHGIWSMFQTLGLNNQRYTKLLHGISILGALAIGIGFSIVPIAVLAGFVTL